MRRILTSLALVSAFAFVACGDNKPDPNTSNNAKPEPSASTSTVASVDPPKEEPKKEEPKKEEPKPVKKTAKEIITADGAVFGFSLADSADAKKMVDDDCGKKAKKDDKKLEACKKDAETAAAVEGIRFEKDAKGDWWWVSFGKEKDKEVVYNKVKFKIASEADGKITLTPEGKDEGKKAMKTLPKEVVLEVPDESTVIMTDPKKGKLTYKKK